MAISSGNHILVPQGPNNSSPHNFYKRYVIPKFNIVSDSAQQGLSIEPIKSLGLCKNALDLILS